MDEKIYNLAAKLYSGLNCSITEHINFIEKSFSEIDSNASPLSKPQRNEIGVEITALFFHSIQFVFASKSIDNDLTEQLIDTLVGIAIEHLIGFTPDGFRNKSTAEREEIMDISSSLRQLFHSRLEHYKRFDIIPHKENKSESSVANEFGKYLNKIFGKSELDVRLLIASGSVIKFFFQVIDWDKYIHELIFIDEEVHNFFNAIEKADLSLVKSFIEKRLSLINTRNDNGYTPLHFVSCLGSETINEHSIIANLLIHKGADVNAIINSTGWTPLHLLAMNGSKESIDVAQIILKNNANPNIRDKMGLTPLLKWKHGDEIRQLLLRYGATY
jgi:hypothetical protein